MKRFAAFVAVLATANVVHAAGDATEFKWDAELRTRYFNNTNMGRNQTPPIDTSAPATGSVYPSTAAWEQRSSLGLTMNKGESITGRVRLINNMLWGRTGQVASSPGTNVDNTAQPTQVNNNNFVYVNEAWVGWAINSNVTMKVGRMALATLADGMVLSNNDWIANPYSSDGVQFIFDYDWGRIGVMGVKAADSGVISAGSPASDPETNFYGASFDAKNLPEWLKVANVHVIQQNKDFVASTGMSSVNFTSNQLGLMGLNVMRYGITLMGDTNNIDYGVTYAGLNGKLLLNKTGTGTFANKDDVNWNASMLHAKAGYTFADMMKLRLGVTYHQDSGNEGGASQDSVGVYQPFFAERHATAGRMDIVGMGNLTYIAINANIEPTETLKVGVDYLMFSRTRTNANSFAYDETYASTTTASNALGSAGANNDKAAIGTEIDVYATQKYDNGMELTARFGQFQAGDFLKNNNVTVEDARQFMLEGRMMF